MIQNAISTQDLTKVFIEKNNIVTAISNLSINVNEGQITAFLGPNGAGKTTTMRVLAGLLKPTQGKARIFDFDVEKDPNKVRKIIGFLPEDPNLYSRLSVFDNIKYFAKLYQNYDKKKIYELLDVFELNGWINKKVGKLSKGMIQKVALACSLTHYPKVVLLDEPTSSLDPGMQKTVRELIQRLAKEFHMTFFISTHNLPEAEKIADQIIIINHGKLMINGSSNEISAKIGKCLFRVEFTADANKYLNIFTDYSEIKVSNTGSNFIEYELLKKDYLSLNPILLKELIHHGADVAKLEDISPKLEDLYLNIIKGGYL